MTGVQVLPIVANAVLVCEICHAAWVSGDYYVGHSENDLGREAVGKVRPAFQEGWRVYLDGWTLQRSYCSDHKPPIPMQLLYGVGADE